MIRLRTATIVATALALVFTGSVALAQTDRAGDVPEISLDRPLDRPIDRPVDRPVDRLVDRPVDRLVDRPVDRPQCDRDRAPDRPADCRDHHDRFDRSLLRRCYHYLVERTDLRPVDDLRRLWRLCHRLWWYHSHVR